MEYEEEDEPEAEVIQLREATVSVPNLPIPKTSDGNVRILFQLRAPHKILHTP